MKIAMIYGEMSAAFRMPDGFDVEGLYSRVGLTGSESSFFNLARSLAEKGHHVVALVPCKQVYEEDSGLVVLPLSHLDGLTQSGVELDAAIAWNEPDYLRGFRPGILRACDQQLNDFGYCKPGWQDVVDVLVVPSANHGRYLVEREGAPGPKMQVIPNSVDLDLLPERRSDWTRSPDRDPHRVVYCSSPDRGLHHLLAMWPDVRARVPDATLRIFYRIEPWIAQSVGIPHDHPIPSIAAIGRRARYVQEALRRLQPGPSSPYGVDVVGPVPNARMMDELAQSAVLAYPCDPVRYTEGFGVSVLDAAAAGCLPIVSTADALRSVHAETGGALGIDGNPAATRDKWVHWIARVLAEGADKIFPDARERMRAHARRHAREVVAAQWEQLLASKIGPR